MNKGNILIDDLEKKILEEYKKGNIDNMNKYLEMLLQLYESIGKNR